MENQMNNKVCVTVRRRPFTVLQKLNAIQILEENNGNFSKIASQLKIDRKCLREWKKLKLN